MKHNLTISTIVMICFCACMQKKETQRQENDSNEVTNTVSTKNQTLGIKEQEAPVNTVDHISVIKERFQQIESNLSNLEKRSISIEVGNPYPLEITGYYKGNKPVKIIKSDLFGHGHAIITSYYLFNENLFFVYRVEHSEESLNGPFTTKETRAYINKNQLLRLLSKKGTFDDINTTDMSKVPNTDITKGTQNKSGRVSKYKSECAKAISQLKNNEEVDKI